MQTRSFSPGLATHFYWIIGAIGIFLVIVGFSRSFFLRSWFDMYPLSWLAKAHGISMMLWFVLFIVQGILAKVGNIQFHKQLGMLSLALIPIILFIGIPNMIVGARLGHAPIPAVPFMAISIVLFFQFSLMAVLGIINRKRPEVHKRFMVLTIISTLAPAFTRMPFEFLFVGFPISIILWSNLLIILCFIYDLKQLGKIHPVYLWGGLFLVSFQILSLVLAASKTWERIANWIIKV